MAIPYGFGCCDAATDRGGRPTPGSTSSVELCAWDRSGDALLPAPGYADTFFLAGELLLDRIELMNAEVLQLNNQLAELTREHSRRAKELALANSALEIARRSGRRSKPAKIDLSRRHEPRNPDAHERCPWHGPVAYGLAAYNRAAGVRAHY